MEERYIASVDLGTSKIAVTVAQVSDNCVQMLYYKETPSEGIRNSYVFNPQKAANVVKEALANAENELKIKIHQVITGLPRYEVSQITATGTLERSDSDSSITKEEIEFLKNDAVDTYPLPEPDKQVIYGIVAQSFTTEDYINAREADIEGMVSETLQGNFKVFIGRKRHSDNVDKVMNSVGVAIAKKYFLPDITAKAVLSQEERENGVALIEIGAGTTSVTVFHNDIMRFYASIPFGGKSITSDIKYECGCSEKLAENIKLGFGICMPEKLLTLRDKILQINNVESGSCKQLSVKYLSEVITSRVKEIIDACLYKIQESGFGNTLRNGIVLTGGSAEIPNLSTYVKELSGYNVRIGYPRQKFSYSGCIEINDTSAVSSVGMIMAAKEDDHLNCLSEAPSLPSLIRDEDSLESTDVFENSPVEEASDTYGSGPAASFGQDYPAAEEESKEERKKNIKKKREERENRNRFKIIWKNPLDNFSKKLNKFIDSGYDAMED